jgi:hypothetical protein
LHRSGEVFLKEKRKRITVIKRLVEGEFSVYVATCMEGGKEGNDLGAVACQKTNII